MAQIAHDPRMMEVERTGYLVIPVCCDIGICSQDGEGKAVHWNEIYE